MIKIPLKSEISRCVFKLQRWKRWSYNKDWIEIDRTHATIARSWIHRARILKKPMFLDFKKWVKSIHTVGYNGARTVCILDPNNNKLFSCGILKCYCQIKITCCCAYYSSRHNTYESLHMISILEFFSYCYFFDRKNRVSKIL